MGPVKGGFTHTCIQTQTTTEKLAYLDTVSLRPVMAARQTQTTTNRNAGGDLPRDGELTPRHGGQAAFTHTYMHPDPKPTERR